MLTIYLQPTVGPCSITYGVFVFIFIHIKAHWLKSLASVSCQNLWCDLDPISIKIKSVWALFGVCYHQELKIISWNLWTRLLTNSPKKNGADWIFSLLCRGLLRLAMLMKATLCEVLDVEIKIKSQTPSNKQLSLLGERKTWIQPF